MNEKVIKKQIDKLKEAARKLETGNYEKMLDEKLKQIVKSQKSEKPSKSQI